MGGKQRVVREETGFSAVYTKMTKPTDSHKRFCSVCHMITYAFRCCSQKTRRVNMQRTIGSQLSSEGLSSERSSEEVKK